MHLIFMRAWRTFQNGNLDQKDLIKVVLENELSSKKGVLQKLLKTSWGKIHTNFVPRYSEILVENNQRSDQK